MTSEFLIHLINTYGLGLAVILVIVIGFSKLVTEQGPLVLRRWQKRKAARQEHSQSLEDRKLRADELLKLAEAGSKTYTEGQLTQHLAEVYGEFHEVNKFVREGVSLKLIRIEAKLEQIIICVDKSEISEQLTEFISTVKALHMRLDEVMITIERGENKT